MSPKFKKRKMVTEEKVGVDEPIRSLPTEIIYNILIRLSVKSLSRLRGVSKTWLSIISSPGFIKEHRQFPLVNRNVILGYSKEPCALTFYTCSLDHYLKKHKSTPIRLEVGSDLDTKFVLVFGSCNGLCCMVFCNGLILCNLSTRKLKFIPKPVRNLSYGFGYDDTLDDYKIVNLQVMEVGKLLVRVYSLRADSWTEIQGHCSKPVIAILLQVGCPFVSGKLHWLGRPKNKTSLIVLSYDLKTGSIGELMLPPYDETQAFKFGVYRGYLYLGQRSDAWIMSEYGVQESWESISSKWSEEERKLRMEKGWDELKDDGLVCNVEPRLWYSGLRSGVRGVPYIESLVSPTF